MPAGKILCRPDGNGNGSNVGNMLSPVNLDHRVDDSWFNERFIALNVDDDVSLQAGGNLAQSVRAASVAGIGHDTITPEAADGIKDAPVVGSDDNPVNRSSFFRPGIYVLDERPPHQRGQGFARKPCGTVPRGYDDHGLQETPQAERLASSLNRLRICSVEMGTVPTSPTTTPAATLAR